MVDDADLVVERVAALDLGKAGLEACVRVPHPQRPGRRIQELRGYATTIAQLLATAAWWRHWQVQRVVMESTSTYWKGVYYLLEAEGFDYWLVTGREIKNVPDRAAFRPVPLLLRLRSSPPVRRRIHRCADGRPCGGRRCHRDVGVRRWRVHYRNRDSRRRRHAHMTAGAIA
jgi:hypothetical protein